MRPFARQVAAALCVIAPLGASQVSAQSEVPLTSAELAEIARAQRRPLTSAERAAVMRFEAQEGSRRLNDTTRSRIFDTGARPAITTLNGGGTLITPNR